MTDTRCHHEWTPTDDGTFACTQCSATTHPCAQCHEPLETANAVCDRCVTRAKRIVADVAEWITTFEFGVQLVNLRAIRYDRDKITTSDDAARLPFGLDQVITDPEDTRIAAVKHPDEAVAILRDWATVWANTRTEIVGDDPLGYLLDRTLWAMQNQTDSGWELYHADALQVRATVRRLLGIAPEREPVPCVHCGGRIIRDWTHGGLDDVRKCTRCRMEWPTEARLHHTNMLVHQQLPDTHPDALVTTEQARRIYPTLNAATLRSWIHRGHLTPAGHDVRGADLYRLGDITDRMEGHVA
ncbi:hypothetical protein [Isoptericola sp. NPDC056605]|uniref:hypothetical protein n=1 Tax=Isoptericola sp. NPDC056605 TaxID=3345876 RepID=UPI0036CB2570